MGRASSGTGRRVPGSLPSIVVGVAIVLAATVAVAAVAIVARPGVPDAADATAGSPASGGGAPASPTDTGPLTTDAGAGSCEQQTLSAPTEGRWLLHRAEYGSRGGRDYLRLMLRRDGAAGEAASLAAEIIPAGDVASRHPVQPPEGASSVLVARFDGPVRIPGAFGGRGSGTLRDFTISSAGGSTYVVAAINGPACFTLDGGAWGAGQPDDQADITLLIERR